MTIINTNDNNHNNNNDNNIDTKPSYNQCSAPSSQEIANLVFSSPTLSLNTRVSSYLLRPLG